MGRHLRGPVAYGQGLLRDKGERCANGRAAGLDNLETQVNTIIGIGSLEDAPIRADFEGEIVDRVSLLDDDSG